MDMIFCQRQFQENCIKQDRPLYIFFVAFTKAFDTVGRTGQWQLMKIYGCPEKFITMIESLHTGLLVNRREVSDIFSITDGVKEGCVLSPTLFYIFVSEMLVSIRVKRNIYRAIILSTILYGAETWKMYKGMGGSYTLS